MFNVSPDTTHVSASAVVAPTVLVRPVAVGGGGATTGLTGYSILEADDLAAAVAMGEGCPIIGDGGRVEVYETIPLG